ncbi:hypothetical protein [Vibrio diabolicus]|uniref:hypothetical protein n=1 Tax=Vibrio diabolicus TaxID=50719 RepID=UPI002ED7B6CF
MEFIKNLELVDLTSIIPAVFALLGVMISNYYNGKRAQQDFANSVQLKEKELKRAKLEEMHFLFQKWELDVIGMCEVFKPCFSKKRTLAEAIELSMQNRLQEKSDQQKFQTLMQLYFDDIDGEYNKVIEKSSKVLEYCQLGVSLNSKKLASFQEDQAKFIEQAKTFKQVLAQQVRQL